MYRKLSMAERKKAIDFIKIVREDSFYDSQCFEDLYSLLPPLFNVYNKTKQQYIDVHDELREISQYVKIEGISYDLDYVFHRKKRESKNNLKDTCFSFDKISRIRKSLRNEVSIQGINLIRLFNTYIYYSKMLLRYETVIKNLNSLIEFNNSLD